MFCCDTGGGDDGFCSTACGTWGSGTSAVLEEGVVGAFKDTSLGAVAWGGGVRFSWHSCGLVKGSQPEPEPHRLQLDGWGNDWVLGGIQSYLPLSSFDRGLGILQKSLICSIWWGQCPAGSEETPFWQGLGGHSCRNCSSRDSIVRVIREHRACSLAAHAWHQSGRTSGFENFSSRLMKGSVSHRGLPKMICAGEMLQSGLGVLHSCRIARRKRLQSTLPVGPVLDTRRCLAVFYCHLCSAIQLRKVGWGHSISYSPEAEEGLCTTSSKFGATITGKFFRNTKFGRRRNSGDE